VSSRTVVTVLAITSRTVSVIVPTSSFRSHRTVGGRPARGSPGPGEGGRSDKDEPAGCARRFHATRQAALMAFAAVRIGICRTLGGLSSATAFGTTICRTPSLYSAVIVDPSSPSGSGTRRVNAP